MGPARGHGTIWYYDILDVSQHLQPGDNEITFLVVRYFSASRAAMPFVRTPFPGLTVVGDIAAGESTLSLNSREGWKAQVNEDILFPTGLVDDVFLHVSHSTQ